MAPQFSRERSQLSIETVWPSDMSQLDDTPRHPGLSKLATFSQKVRDPSDVQGPKTPVKSTISRDNTAGENVRNSALLAQYGRKVEPRVNASILSPLLETQPDLRYSLNTEVHNAVAAQYEDESQASTSQGPAQTSSYWSVAESDQFPSLLRSFGSNWDAIAYALGSKTAVMVKNYFVRQKEGPRPDFEVIVQEADSVRFAFPPKPSYTPRELFGRS